MYMQYINYNLSQNLLFLFLLSLITKAITRQLRVLLGESEPCLVTPWMVLNFLSSLQRVHKELVLSPLCSCYQNKQKFTRTCRRKFSTDSSRKSAALRAISDSQPARHDLFSRVTLRVRGAIFQSPICLHGAIITALSAQGNFREFLPLWHRYYWSAGRKLRTHT